jgi:hypothetical protein
MSQDDVEEVDEEEFAERFDRERLVSVCCWDCR